MSEHSPFVKTEETHPSSITLDSRSYPGLDLKNLKIQGNVDLIIKGRITGIREHFDDKVNIDVTIEAMSVDIKSTRSDLDEDGRVK